MITATKGLFTLHVAKKLPIFKDTQWKQFLFQEEEEEFFRVKARSHLGTMIFTVRNSNCGKVMFSHVSVCPQVGGVHPPCRRQTPPGQTTLTLEDTPRWADISPRADTPPPPPTPTRRPLQTGMHSCFYRHVWTVILTTLQPISDDT